MKQITIYGQHTHIYYILTIYCKNACKITFQICKNKKVNKPYCFENIPEQVFRKTNSVVYLHSSFYLGLLVIVPEVLQYMVNI